MQPALNFLSNDIAVAYAGTKSLSPLLGRAWISDDKKYQFQFKPNTLNPNGTAAGSVRTQKLRAIKTVAITYIPCGPGAKNTMQPVPKTKSNGGLQHD